MRLDPFYLIVDDPRWLERLLPLGVKLVQLRIKDRSEDGLREAIRASARLCNRHGATLVVNDYWRLAIEERCGFVHLGQEDLDGADLGALRAADVKLGVSTHDSGELERALALSPSYVALGPIFPTLLKPMSFAPQGLARIGEWKARAEAIPLVAIGGLTPERAEACLRAGADSACVLTDVLRHANPEVRANEWLAATAKYRGAKN
ncbi:MAG: thiamine phosphate synthase [Methylocystis sp.]